MYYCGSSLYYLTACVLMYFTFIQLFNDLYQLHSLLFYVLSYIAQGSVIECRHGINDWSCLCLKSTYTMLREYAFILCSNLVCIRFRVRKRTRTQNEAKQGSFTLCWDPVVHTRRCFPTQRKMFLLPRSSPFYHFFRLLFTYCHSIFLSCLRSFLC